MVERLADESALESAIRILGSQSKLARLCGVSGTAAWKWVKGGKPLPAEFVLTVEAATGISRHDLRPDIYPIENSGPPSPEAAPAAASELCAAGDRDRSIEGLRS